MSKQEKQLERIRSEITKAVAAELRAHPEVRAVLVLPIIIETEFPKPRLPYSIWLARQYSGAAK